MVYGDGNNVTTRRYSLFLVTLRLFSFLLLLRVLGQLVVVRCAPRWLPPMHQWQSGLLPYPVLLLAQVLVLSVMFWICADFSRGQGMFVEPIPGAAHTSRGSATSISAVWPDVRR